MKNNAIRKTLSGEYVEFKFAKGTSNYFVKNFTNSFVLATFDPEKIDADAFKIPSQIGEEVQLPFGKANAIYVKGTGEVEVQQLV